MILSARPLTNVTDVNHFTPVTEIKSQIGDAFDLYLQLVDLDQLTSENQFRPTGLRYIPAVGATLTLRLGSVDSSKVVTRMAVQPFSNDSSIWRISIQSTDPIRGTIDIKGTLIEGPIVRTFNLSAGLLVGDPSGVC